MVKVKILRGCVCNLKTCAPGDIVEVPEGTANVMAGAGTAERASEQAQPAKKKVAKKVANPD